jgi:hypothetical protein
VYNIHISRGARLGPSLYRGLRGNKSDALLPPPFLSSTLSFPLQTHFFHPLMDVLSSLHLSLSTSILQLKKILPHLSVSFNLSLSSPVCFRCCLCSVSSLSSPHTLSTLPVMVYFPLYPPLLTYRLIYYVLYILYISSFASPTSLPIVNNHLLII